jgi:heat shock protein HslJ
MFVRELKFRAAVLMLLTVLAYSAVSCGLMGGSNDDLAGTTWKIETMGGAPPPVTLIITAEFNDGRVSGSSGCNSYGATYTINNGKLEIGDIAVTEMACLEESVMQFEQSFLELLGMVRSYSLSESRLDLMDEAGNAVLSFVSVQ